MHWFYCQKLKTRDLCRFELLAANTVEVRRKLAEDSWVSLKKLFARNPVEFSQCLLEHRNEILPQG